MFPLKEYLHIYCDESYFFFNKQKQHHNFRKTKKPYCIEKEEFSRFLKYAKEYPTVSSPIDAWYSTLIYHKIQYNQVFFHRYMRSLLSISSGTHVCIEFTSTSICNKGNRKLNYRRLYRVFLKESKLREFPLKFFAMFLVFLHHNYLIAR